jgi:ABC-type polar amino acid transport system, ATPase component
MVFQQFNLFEHMTAQENIMLALEKVLGKSHQEAQKIAHDLLAQYGLHDKKNNYPSQLSGGQKQRLALARTIALKPQIICFDEPTSALDPLLTSHVAHTIQKLADAGYIILIATHDTVLIDKLNCDIYLMENGKIIEAASSQSFTENKKQYPLIEAFVSGIIT